MPVLLILLVIVFAHIHYKDSKHRLIFTYDLAALVALRIIVLVVVWLEHELAGLNVVADLAYDRWGMHALVCSLVVACIVVLGIWLVTVITNRLVNLRDQKEESLGVGDIKLYAVCCLFIRPEDAFLFVVLSSLGGAALALYAHVVRHERTFAFAPAIVWSCYLTLILDWVGI